MATYLLDTNTCIYIRQRRPQQAYLRFSELPLGEAALSVVTLGELAFGVEKSTTRSQSLKTLEDLASFIPVLALPPEAGNAYGAFRAYLERKGETIGNSDLWIAAHAHSANLTLVTNNEREFRRLPELRIENWTS